MIKKIIFFSMLLSTLAVLYAQENVINQENILSVNSLTEIDNLIIEIEDINKSISEIETSYQNQWEEQKEIIGLEYLNLIEDIDNYIIEPWETVEEFEERKNNNKHLQRESYIEQSELLFNNLKITENEELAELNSLLDQKINNLEQKKCIIDRNGIEIIRSDFIRSSKIWYFYIRSNDPAIPYETIISKDISSSENIGESYRYIENIINEELLDIEIKWSLKYEELNDDSFNNTLIRNEMIFNLYINDIILKNSLNNHIISEYHDAELNVASFEGSTNRLNPISKMINLTLINEEENTDIYYYDYFLGTTPLQIKLFNSGDINLKLKFNNIEDFIKFETNININENSIIDLANIIPSECIHVQSGFFNMGSDMGYQDENPIHTVTITKGYWISESEITRERWANVYYWAIQNGYSFSGSYSTNILNNNEFRNYPVTNVSWLDVIIWCNAASEMDEIFPVYTSNENIIRYPIDVSLINEIDCNFNSHGYRLPTEAEWEYAARGGSYENHNIYSGSNIIEEVAWYSENSNGEIQQVKIKNSNELGLYDMSGNVWEWCWDFYGVYSNLFQFNPTGLEVGRHRVKRGGSYNESTINCRVYNRYGYESDSGRWRNYQASYYRQSYYGGAPYDYNIALNSVGFRIVVPSDYCF